MTDFDPRTCEHEQSQITFRPDINNNPRYQRQCVRCGIPVGQFISQAEIKRLKLVASTPRFDVALMTRMEELSQRLTESHWDEKRERYHQYLQTDAWRAKANLVHRRGQRFLRGVWVKTIYPGAPPNI